MPGAERVRFGKTGSDVTTAAIRLARACTGREAVVACGYHGWHDWYIGTTTRNLGVPEVVTGLVSTFPFDDLEALSVQASGERGQAGGRQPEAPSERGRLDVVAVERRAWVEEAAEVAVERTRAQP